jgi:hypothetical protein
VTNFADLAAIARVTLDAVHGEVARLKPQDRTRGPHGRKTQSVDRPATDITVAFYRDTELQARKRAQPMIGQTGERMLNRSPEIFGSTAFSGAIAEGDHLARPKTGELFEIVSKDPDDLGNFILGLSAIKA